MRTNHSQYNCLFAATIVTIQSSRYNNLTHARIAAATFFPRWNKDASLASKIAAIPTRSTILLPVLGRVGRLRDRADSHARDAGTGGSLNPHLASRRDSSSRGFDGLSIGGPRAYRIPERNGSFVIPREVKSGVKRYSPRLSGWK